MYQIVFILVIFVCAWETAWSQSSNPPYVITCPLSIQRSNYKYDEQNNEFTNLTPSQNVDENTVRELVQTSLRAKSFLSEDLTKMGNNGDDFIVGRECVCGSRERNKTVICPIKYGETHCRIPTSDQLSVECLNLSEFNQFLLSAWPLSLFWLVALSVYLISTEQGRLTIKYACSRICFCSRATFSNSRIIENIISRETALRELFQIASLTRTAQQQQNNNPRTYILKTKAYNSKTDGLKKKRHLDQCDVEMPPVDDSIVSSPSNETALTSPESFSSSPSFDIDPKSPQQPSHIEDTFENSPYNTPTKHTNVDDVTDNDDEVMCTICIADIENGDRVGCLPCDHLFHADCLKEWIKRRNVCPLCQEPIAEEKSNGEGDGSTSTTRRPTTFTVRSTGGAIDLRRQRRSRRRPTSSPQEANDGVNRQLFYVNRERSTILENIPPSVASNAGVTMVQLGRNNRRQMRTHRMRNSVVESSGQISPST